jgi:hypothetical protein
MGLPSPEQARTWGGKLIVDRDGAPIGTVTQIYSDNSTGLPEWATIRLGEATVFLPLLDAQESDGRVRVSVKRDDVAKAPLVGPGERISEQEEARLYRHYGIEYSPERSPSGLPAGVGPLRRPGLVQQVWASRPLTLALTGVLALASVVAAVLGVRRRSDRRSPPGQLLAAGATALSSPAAAGAGARATIRAARRAAQDARRQAKAAAEALDEAPITSPAPKRRRRGRRTE